MEIRRQAFEKLNGEEPNCSNANEIICAHCGSEIIMNDLYEIQDIECPVCEGEMTLEVGQRTYYTTSIKGKRVIE